MKVSDLPQRRILEYKEIIGSQKINELLNLAETLGNIKVAHVNSTAYGGGVAEILYNLVSLMRDVGVDTEWFVIEAPSEFFKITKKIHHGLQGMGVEISVEEKKFYMNVLKENLSGIDLAKDIIVIHDPQPLGLRTLAEQSFGKWVWRCHIDLSTSYRPVWDFVREMLRKYDASIFHMKEFVHPDTPTPKVFTMPPSIDPLSPKNRELSETEVLRVLERFGINPEKPILTQVGRFDPWKDPFAAIDVYRKVKEKIGDAQLLLITAMPTDDPDGLIYLEKICRRIGEDPNVFILTDYKGVRALEVNAFQRATTVALQMSLREGFGLSVTEALWKKVPVVARPAGGIKLQVIDGVTGYLARDVDEAAKYVVHLIRNPKVRKELGENGHRHVKENFIITKHLENYLKIFADVLRN